MSVAYLVEEYEITQSEDGDCAFISDGSRVLLMQAQLASRDVICRRTAQLKESSAGCASRYSSSRACYSNRDTDQL